MFFQRKKSLREQTEVIRDLCADSKGAIEKLSDLCEINQALIYTKEFRRSNHYSRQRDLLYASASEAAVHF